MAEMKIRSPRRGPDVPKARLALLAPALCALLVSATGCPGVGGQCTINDDCAAGELCLESVCSATCDSDSDCGSGESCSNGLCVSGEDPEPSPGEPDQNEPDPIINDGGEIEPDVAPEDGGGVEPDAPPTDGGEPDAGEPDTPEPEPNDGGPTGPDGGPNGPDGGPIGPDDGGPGPNPDGGPDGGGPTGPDGGPDDGGTPTPDPDPEDGGVDAGPPPPAPPVVTSVTPFATRVNGDGAVDSFVFDIEGTDVNSNPAQIFLSVFNSNNEAIITDFLLSVNAAAFDLDGTNFSIRVFVSGFAGLNGGPAVRTEIRVADTTGLSAATGTSADLPGPPQSGGTCPIPDQESFIPCPVTNVCLGVGDVGTCGTVNTQNPTLNPVPDLVRLVNDPNCQNVDFPDGLSFQLTGTSEQRVVTITLDGANNLTLNNPSTPPNFNITGSVCARADAAGAVSFTVTDESGRVSNAAAGNIPPP